MQLWSQTSAADKMNNPDISDVELLEFLIGYNGNAPSGGGNQAYQDDHLQQPQPVQLLGYCNNNNSGANVSWTLEVVPQQEAEVKKELEEPDERMVERWEPGEIVDRVDDDDEEEEEEEKEEEVEEEEKSFRRGGFRKSRRRKRRKEMEVRKLSSY
jgi:hypothetical protein